MIIISDDDDENSDDDNDEPDWIAAYRKKKRSRDSDVEGIYLSRFSKVRPCVCSIFNCSPNVTFQIEPLTFNDLVIVQHFLCIYLIVQLSN